TATNASGSAAAENVELSGDLGTITATGDVATISNADAETREALDLIAAATTDLTKSGTGASATYQIASGASLNLDGLNVGTLDLASTATGSISITTDEPIVVKNNNASTTTDVLTLTGSGITGGDLLSSIAALGSGELTKTKASEFQDVVDNAITDLNGYRGDIGSTQNQVESAVRNLMTQSTNVKAAESIIRDVDYAAESANFNKQNIISQAGSYAISQANSVQQNVLRLLQ
uniref:flagellin n=1 Tax=Arcobacter sp. LA11 TaxID=1898176 RepID=UPI000AFD7B63